MEAAAIGLPIVATDIRGCRQVVDHNVPGLLVPVLDGAALSDAIGAPVGDPGQRAAMGLAARAKAVTDFDDRAQIARTLAEYERLLTRHAAKTRR